MRAKCTWLNRVAASIKSLREAMRAGVSMRVAVLVYLLSLTGILMLGIVLLLSAAGVFSSGREAQKKLMENDLSHIARDISADYKAVSAMCVSYAKLCSSEMEAQMLAQGARANALQQNAGLLEPLLNGAYDSLSSALVQARVSGAFLMLDATVNPSLEGAQNSRACIYLRNMEPNIINATDPYIKLLRGPASVARENGVGMHAQWQMELNVPQDGDLKKELETSAQSGLPLSRAYFWYGPFLLDGTSERTMLCVAPLTASDGTVFGACGFEISEMLFSLSYAPDSGDYPGSFVVFAPFDGMRLALSRAFAAGGGAEPHTGTAQDTELRVLEGSETGFVSMEDGKGRAYAGLTRTIALYPDDSPFAKEGWSVSLMMPRQALFKIVRKDILQLTLLLFLLMAAALFASLFMSRRFSKPLNTSLESIRATEALPAHKTGIREIDELLTSFAARAASEGTAGAAQRTAQADAAMTETNRYALLSEFARNITALSAAERAVFDLYYEGHTAEEIAQKLFLSINTIKTHSKRIYIKLNVSSRKELLVYAAMLKEEAARGSPRAPSF